jgi:hypothetical protein
MDDMSDELFGHDLSNFADQGLSGHDSGLGLGEHDTDLGGATGLGSAMSETLPHEPTDPTDPTDHTDPTDPSGPGNDADHHTGDPTGHDTAGHDPTAHAEPVPHHTHSEHTTADPRTVAPEPTPHYPRPGSHLEMDIYGEHYDTGRVEVDMNGDGHADTSVEHTVRDGVAQVEYYTDNDGDGHADELTITDAEGHLISHTQFDEHTGQWEETHLDHPLPTELPDR